MHGPRGEVDDHRRRSADARARRPAPVDWQRLRRHCHVREMIAQIVPGFEQLADDRRDEAGVPHRRPHLPHAAFPDADRARRSSRACRLPALRGERRRAAADDGPLGGAVQHGRLRGGGHLPRPGRRDVILMNRDDIERAGADGRSARDGAQRSGRDARTSWCARSTSGRATR